MRTILDYLSEVKLELVKVSWPKRDEVIKLTLIVLLITLGFGLYTGVLDYLFVKALEMFITK